MTEEPRTPQTLEELLLQVRMHAQHILVRTDMGFVPLADLPDNLWAEHMANYIAHHLEQGFVAVQPRTEGKQIATK